MLSTHLYKGLDAYKIHNGQKARTCVRAGHITGWQARPSSAFVKRTTSHRPPNTVLGDPRKSLPPQLPRAPDLGIPVENHKNLDNLSSNSHCKFCF